MQEDKHKKKHAPQQDEPVEAPAESTPVVETGAVSAEEYEALKAENSQLQAKAAEYLDSWQRERADFLNYKKRNEREQAQTRENITAAVVKKYLAVLDDLERALRSRPSGGDGASWASGIELILRKLQGILDAEGIQRIPAEDQMFDPALHEAILQEENPAFESGHVTEVLQQGYTLGDRVIRPAQVKVAR